MTEDRNAATPPGPDDMIGTANRTMLFLAALMVAVVIFFASFYPRPLFFPTVSSLLTISAISAAAVALFRLQRPSASHFTLWDVAAILMFIALGAGMFTDPAELQAYLQTVNATETAPAAAGDQRPAPPSTSLNR